MIIIPMTGLSSRFTKAGYTKPKYMLPLGNKSIFMHSVESFSSYFDSMSFLFVIRNISDTELFIRREINKMKIKKTQIVILEQETSGQAETVELGILKAELNEKEPLTIFNIDTFRKDFSFPQEGWFKASDGYLEVFKGKGINWSYVEPWEGCDEPRVIRTTEKEPISDLCCNGLYHFVRTEDFLYALMAERNAPTMPELYVAPLYNHLIKKDYRIHYNCVDRDKMVFCGVPEEYENLLQLY